MEEQLKLGERLTELLTTKNIDNKTFAEIIGVNVSTVGRWRNGQKYMRLSQIVKIAAVSYTHLTLPTT